MSAARAAAQPTPARNRTNAHWLRDQLLAWRKGRKRAAAYGDPPLTDAEFDRRLADILDGKESA